MKFILIDVFVFVGATLCFFGMFSAPTFNTQFVVAAIGLFVLTMLKIVSGVIKNGG